MALQGSDSLAGPPILLRVLAQPGSSRPVGCRGFLTAKGGSMATLNIGHRRLCNHQIVGSTFETPGAVVAWLGAVQAQDYLGALWTVALRTPHATEAAVVRAIGERAIIRTWPMRGTLHFVAPE